MKFATASVDYVETVKVFGETKSLRSVGLHLLNQFDTPVNWFENALDYELGFLFRRFVANVRACAPKGKVPAAMVVVVDGNHAAIMMPSGALAVSTHPPSEQ